MDLREGFLFKEVDSTLRWHRRWMVLSQPNPEEPADLSYWERDDSATALTGEPRAVAKLVHAEISNTKAPRPGRFAFKLSLDAGLNTKGRAKWVLSGSTAAETEEWVAALVQAGATSKLDAHLLGGPGKKPFGHSAVHAAQSLHWLPHRHSGPQHRHSAELMEVAARVAAHAPRQQPSPHRSAAGMRSPVQIRKVPARSGVQTAMRCPCRSAKCASEAGLVCCANMRSDVCASGAP
jgi:hypothetical protein